MHRIAERFSRHQLVGDVHLNQIMDGWNDLKSGDPVQQMES